MPVFSKSTKVVSRVTEAAGCSPRAASTPSAVDRMVPPTQKPKVSMLSLPPMACTVRMARMAPFSM